MRRKLERVAIIVVMLASACGTDAPGAPAPGAAEATRLTEAAGHLQQAGSYRVTCS